MASRRTGVCVCVQGDRSSGLRFRVSPRDHEPAQWKLKLKMEKEKERQAGEGDRDSGTRKTKAATAGFLLMAPAEDWRGERRILEWSTHSSTGHWRKILVYYAGTLTQAPLLMVPTGRDRTVFLRSVSERDGRERRRSSSESARLSVHEAKKQAGTIILFKTKQNKKQKRPSTQLLLGGGRRRKLCSSHPARPRFALLRDRETESCRWSSRTRHLC